MNNLIEYLGDWILEQLDSYVETFECGWQNSAKDAAYTDGACRALFDIRKKMDDMKIDHFGSSLESAITELKNSMDVTYMKNAEVYFHDGLVNVLNEFYDELKRILEDE